MKRPSFLVSCFPTLGKYGPSVGVHTLAGQFTGWRWAGVRKWWAFWGDDQGRGGWDFRLKEAKSLTSDWTLLRNKPVYLVLNVEELEKEGGNTRHREIVFINGEMFLKDSLCAKARIIAKIAATKLTRLSITSSDWTADDTGLAITNTIIMASTRNQTNQIRIAV